MTTAGPDPASGMAAALRTVLDAIPASIAMLDREQRHRYVNREYAAFVGLPTERIQGCTIEEMPGCQADDPRRGEQALAGRTVQWDGWVSAAGGHDTRYVQRVYLPYRTEGGTIDGYFIFSRDLTTLKQNERQISEQLDALRGSEALNAAIIDSALDCVIVINETGRIIAFNMAAIRTFGYSRAEAMGELIGDLIVPPALRARHVAGFQRYLATGEPHVLGRRIELQGMRADGTEFPVELAITEVRVPGRRLFTAYLRDLTDARRTAAEIQRQREALHQSEKMTAFGSLLAGVAHELNNPLSIVVGNALMLEEEARDRGAPGLTHRAETIRAAAERCAGIVRSFLAMARQRQAQPVRVSIATLVDAATRLLAYGLRADDIDVETRVPANLPDVLGDATQIQQVLANMLINARQALERHPPPRRIVIAARAETGFVVLSIADNGPGIPASIRGRVFDPFFTTKPVGIGTGIGLSISRGIAQAHGGNLTLADPQGGDGACFELTLPFAVGNPAAESAGTPPAEAMVLATALVVDDEREVAAVLAHMLRGAGYWSTLAASGEAAQMLLGERDYDLIVCDLHMPDMDGPSLYAWLQTHKPHLCGRVAFVTGDTLGPVVKSFLTGAGRPVLEKPFVPADVRRMLAELAPE